MLLIMLLTFSCCVSLGIRFPSLGQKEETGGPQLQAREGGRTGRPDHAHPPQNALGTPSTADRTLVQFRQQGCCWGPGGCRGARLASPGASDDSPS